MLHYMQRITRARREDGASAVEYGLLVAAIAAIIVVIVFAIGKVVQSSFKSTCEDIANGGASGSNASCATS